MTPAVMLDRDAREIAAAVQDAAKPLAGRTLLLTGSAGFLGQWMLRVVDRLNADVLAKPCRVIALDTAEPPVAMRDALAKPEAVSFLIHDLAKSLDIEEPVQFAIHMAGIASPAYYRAKPLETLDVSFFGTRQVCELAKRDGARMLYFSSSEIYGDPDPRNVPTPETYRGNVSPTGPRACYDEGKRIGETLCSIYAEHFGVPVVTVRPFNVYGPGMKERDYRVLPNFASALKAGRPLLVYGDGRQTRTYCYVTDAMAGFLLALLKGGRGEPYNIGNSEPEVSVLELIERIERILGRPVEKRLVPHPASYPADEPSRRCPDLAKARRDLGYAPKIPLDEGLRRYLAWTDLTYTGG